MFYNVGWALGNYPILYLHNTLQTKLNKSRILKWHAPKIVTFAKTVRVRRFCICFLIWNETLPHLSSRRRMASEISVGMGFSVNCCWPWLGTCKESGGGGPLIAWWTLPQPINELPSVTDPLLLLRTGLCTFHSNLNQVQVHSNTSSSSSIVKFLLKRNFVPKKWNSCATLAASNCDK